MDRGYGQQQRAGVDPVRQRLWRGQRDGARTQTVYYTAAANSKVAACGEHPEWANLPCQVQPAAQPVEHGLPRLQITTYTYNLWDEPETTTNTSGWTIRTTTQAYDAAGRLKTSAVSCLETDKEPCPASDGTALPTVSNEYNKENGALEKQCINEGKPCSEGKPKTIAYAYNTLGQLTSYTDAAEATTTYEYDVDGRVKKTNDGKGTEAVTYSTTTGLPTELVNEYGTTKLAFTAKYDVEGNMLSEAYPNGMTAYYTYNPTGTATNLEYKKLTDCTEEKKNANGSPIPSLPRSTGSGSHRRARCPNRPTPSTPRAVDAGPEHAGRQRLHDPRVRV